MVLIRVPKFWQLSEAVITPETIFFNRRRFLKTLAWTGIGTAIGPMLSLSRGLAFSDPLAGTQPLQSTQNLAFDPGRPITEREVAAIYNNFYEFGDSKSIWQAAQALPTDAWQVEVTGLVKYPRIYDLDDLQKFPLEERVYRHRCVEAWAMVVPWIGFPMKLLMQAVEPTSDAKYVRFTSYYDPEITPGPERWSSLPFPYTEGLRIDEMANELAFFAVGIYGETLPKQHGAPIRMVIPWKYGYKSAKSIVKVEFTAEQPATFWNSLFPDEYPFESNVNPNVPHPRWSQEYERLLSADPPGETYPTLPYNGYGEFVAHLYS
jgi:methionine sulfoxide reductase catalytic subunit